MKSMFQNEEMVDTDSSIDATSKQNNSVNADSVRQKNADKGTQYFIRKVKALEYFEKTAIDFMLESQPDHRDVEYLQKMSIMLRSFMRRFDKLKNKKSESEEIIYKYSYIVYRLFEESKIMTLVMFTDEKIE